MFRAERQPEDATLDCGSQNLYEIMLMSIVVLMFCRIYNFD